MRASGWRNDNINSLTKISHETNEMNSSLFAKYPRRTSAILNVENDDKNCFNSSIIAGV